ncbi:CILP [Branchiostoma lanceolatum]|uniref:CILP protein n=1 Tax=Branchiostoma lanceolatum TaxID=7740 RepID=A0A8S4MMH4_BRALA|nr:CILP [Branchiostoma lanceolatum]
MRPPMGPLNRHNRLGPTYKYKFFSPPVMTSHPSSKTRLVGESVTFCCSAHGTPQPYLYEWFRNGDVLPNTIVDNSTLILHNLTTSDAGENRCRANSDAGAKYSRPATLTIYGT